MQLPSPNLEFPRYFVAFDGFQVQYLPQNGDTGLEAFHFVVKRSYDLEPGAARPAAMQRPLNLADVYYEGEIDPLKSPLRYESDLMPPKPACDVIVNGHCYAPGGEAIQCVCTLKVGNNPIKRVRVIGDRTAWLHRNQRRASISPARRFNVMPLRWEFAYGGIDLQAQTGFVPHPGNPAGMGFWAAPYDELDVPEKDHYGPLPNLENPDRPIAVRDLLVDVLAWEKGPTPWGFGWVPKSWEPRAGQAGMDPKMRGLWDMLHKAPPMGIAKLPFREMQPSFLNGAPPGQRIPHPNGGELVVLEHVHATEAELRFRLPVDTPKVRWSLGGDDPMQPVKLRIDTITIEPDVMALDMVWRGSLPSPEGFSLDKFERPPQIEVNGEATLPAQLLDSGFPIELITEGKV